jgi:hypothetical protein
VAGAYRLLADLVVLVHLAFIGFVLLGALVVWRRPLLAWLHLPAVAWAALLEAFGWVCPLTPLENALRRLGDEPGYAGGFVERYVLPLIYPEALTRELQLALAAGVIALNALLYAALIARRTRPV